MVVIPKRNSECSGCFDGTGVARYDVVLGCGQGACHPSFFLALASCRILTLHAPAGAPARPGIPLPMSESPESFSYSGSELEAFALATNWKSYWSDHIRRFLGQDVLELGAGLGATAKTLNDGRFRSWLALEPDARMCEIIRAQLGKGELPPAYQIRQGASTDLHPGERFDTILYIDVLEHIEHDREELGRVSGCLTAGGHIVIVAPAHNFLFSRFDQAIGHHRRYDRRMLRNIVPDGMRVRELYYLDSVGLLASLANKLVLHSESPTQAQIRFWDSLLVRASRWMDPLLFRLVGKTVVCVLQK